MLQIRAERRESTRARDDAQRDAFGNFVNGHGQDERGAERTEPLAATTLQPSSAACRAAANKSGGPKPCNSELQ